MPSDPDAPPFLMIRRSAPVSREERSQRLLWEFSSLENEGVRVSNELAEAISILVELSL
jgi:hypothetical protein